MFKRCCCLALTWILVLAPVAFAGDSLPAGAISFFNLSSCPEGWVPLDIADGRLVASLMPGGGNGALIGAALSDLEDRKHTHDFGASITANSVSYVLSPSCCNDNLSHSGTYHFAGVTDEASSGLPYVQLLLCTKMESPPPTAPPPPSGFLMYHQLFSCPPGYRQPLLTLGRFLVGLPENGSPGLSFGGPPLLPQMENGHDHLFTGSVSLAKRDVAGADGCCAGAYAGAQSYGFSGVSADHPVDLPFIQLLNCERD